MTEVLTSSTYAAVFVSLLFYCLGMLLQKKLRSALCNPLLISVAATIGFLLLFRLDYETYRANSTILSYLLTPATVCLAVPLYENLQALKKNVKAILLGILSGIAANLAIITLLKGIFALSQTQFVTLLPKSITSAIGMGVSEELGGMTSITVAVIILAGIFANIVGETVLKLIRVREPIAKGLALGTSGHAIGTARANEMGELEGAVSGLAIAVTGLISAVIIPIFAGLF